VDKIRPLWSFGFFTALAKQQQNQWKTWSLPKAIVAMFRHIIHLPSYYIPCNHSVWIIIKIRVMPTSQ
jgi:hypothetical protein